MFSTVFESQLSVKSDNTKTKRYPQESPVYLIHKNTGIVHVWRHQEGETGALSNSDLFYIFGQSLLFFLNRAGGVKSLYFQADVIRK